MKANSPLPADREPSVSGLFKTTLCVSTPAPDDQSSGGLSDFEYRRVNLKMTARATARLRLLNRVFLISFENSNV